MANEADKERKKLLTEIRSMEEQIKAIDRGVGGVVFRDCQ